MMTHRHNTPTKQHRPQRQLEKLSFFDTLVLVLGEIVTWPVSLYFLFHYETYRRDWRRVLHCDVKGRGRSRIY